MTTNLSRCQNLPTNTTPASSFGCVASPVLPSLGSFRSGFGVRPGRSSGAPTFHAGIDFEAARGEPVFSIASGVVERVTTDETARGPFAGYGNAVVVKHPNGLWSFYAHLSSVDVSTGQTVLAGDLLGKAGSTTNGKFPGMGAHLHFEVRVAGPGGTSPFPAAYCRYNIDPKPLLEQAGLSFGLGGKITAAGQQAVCGLAQQSTVAARSGFAGVRGGGFGPLYGAASPAIASPYERRRSFSGLGDTETEENDYEPPEGPDWSVKWGPILAYGGLGAVTAGVLATVFYYAGKK